MKVSELKSSDKCYYVLKKHGCIVKSRYIGIDDMLILFFRPEDDIYHEKYGWHQEDGLYKWFPTLEQAMIFARDNAIADLGKNINLKYTRLVLTLFYLNKSGVYDEGMTFEVDSVDDDTEQAISENKFEYELDKDETAECEEIVDLFHEKYMVPNDKLESFLNKIGWTNK